jgi:hypothetical protein
MSARRVHTTAQSSVVAGWTEVWTPTPDGSLPLMPRIEPVTRPRIAARFEDGHYRLRERQPVAIPRS